MRGDLKKAKLRVWERDNYICQYCGEDLKEGYRKWLKGLIKRRDAKLTVDHVIPRCKGGTHQDENLVTCCWDCNNKKSLEDPK